MITRVRVAILGLGLIGGSLALALKKSPSYHICGFDVSPQVVTQAVEAGAVDEGTTDLRKAVNRAEIVILCVPVRRMFTLIKEAASFLPSKVIISDVASTKGALLAEIPALLPAGACYVGGHPMAGSEKSGFAAATPHLFVGKPYILTRQPETENGAVEKVQKLVEAIGAVPVVLPGADHDRIVAEISHVPHITAASLVTMVDQSSVRELGLTLAAGGFKDMTRVASSDADMWIDICLTNQVEIIQGLRRLQGVVDGMIDTLTAGDEKALRAFFIRAKEVRDGLLEGKENAD